MTEILDKIILFFTLIYISSNSWAEEILAFFHLNKQTYHRIIESLRLEKAHRIIQSNHYKITKSWKMAAIYRCKMFGNLTAGSSEAIQYFITKIVKCSFTLHIYFQ